MFSGPGFVEPKPREKDKAKPTAISKISAKQYIVAEPPGRNWKGGSSPFAMKSSFWVSS